MLSAVDLEREAAATGFRSEVLEKVIRLIALLERLRSHPFLKSRVVLKGGTALNLFVFDVPRLSVDIDLNYTGAADRETMLAERPKLEQAIQAVCGRSGVQIRRLPGEHAGGKWRMAYVGVSGRSAALDLDVNFLLRTRLGSFSVTQVPMLDVHELAAGKLAALFGRAASRDLFDVRELLGGTSFDREKLRLGFVVYGGASRRDWRTVSIDDVQEDPHEVDRHLVPLLRAGVAPAREDLVEWTRRLVADCRDRLSVVLPLRVEEIEFLDRLNGEGDIAPELLTADKGLQRTIRAHPALECKALNVRKRRGLGDAWGEGNVGTGEEDPRSGGG
jgi:hypothetical protein